MTIPAHLEWTRKIGGRAIDWALVWPEVEARAAAGQSMLRISADLHIRVETLNTYGALRFQQTKAVSDAPPTRTCACCREKFRPATQFIFRCDGCRSSARQYRNDAQFVA
ncbi:hypothetical protein AA103196_3123 [Ameyamaea chiangmaiensis NBRC 103196]|uniref:Uncharacterized protein n=1 Tax=Ameyamaea chiangmaiensis TaxID=442969 RepID=A0A850P3X5_9PROT|nr:hypothetical protein [Ameyamaea chiangmaiensis]MBS4074609.1 hypothetical protein [Ameyamaea chiangmaiensis]NVN39365.1 hypothetical protein [Ameyamaea chiangmaiensis]GBQ72652.1 hypothetical protein AA103196_3123 [Ameyamaea chiangmaiensis NBRC 103196]